jgi:Flp pilus assembly pilin Flp
MIPFMIVGMVVVSGIAAVPYGFLMVKVAAVLLCLAFAVSGGIVAYWVFRPSRTVGDDDAPAVRNTARTPG